MARKWMLALAVTAVALSATAVALAAPLGVGDPAPDWTGLTGVDGKQHSLSDYKDAKVIVLVFTCNHCPVAVAYEDRLIALQKEYQNKGAQVLALCVNNIPPDRLEAMKKRAADKEFNFPYLADPSQKSGRDYGARVTPHVFVLDKDRKVAYIGAIDNNMSADKATKHYVREAIDALLAGKKPFETKTDAVGCGIKYDAK